MQEKVSLGFIFKQIHIAFEAHGNKNLKRYNLTKSQMDVLVYLEVHKDLVTTQRDLEKGLRIKNPTVTGILNRLEEKNLISRKKHPKDKRAKIIEITEKGQNIMQAGYIHMMKMDESIVKGFSDEEKEELIKLLNKVLDNLK